MSDIRTRVLTAYRPRRGSTVVGDLRVLRGVSSPLAPARDILVHLPPRAFESGRRYPVVYMHAAVPLRRRAPDGRLLTDCDRDADPADRRDRHLPPKVSPMTIRTFYGDWSLYNDLVVEALDGMSTEELALRAPSDDTSSSAGWPIWAIAGHTAAARVYWLCNFLGEPGSDRTPFYGVDDGWEDHLDQPRSAAEIVAAWTTTWQIVERALDRWTPAMLDEPMSPDGEAASAHLTRRSLIHRLMFHEAFHVGEIAVIQGMHGRPQLDLWPPGYHTVEAAAARKPGA